MADHQTLDTLADEHGHVARVLIDAERAQIQVGRMIGRGGYAAVFEAHSADGDNLALKVPLAREKQASQHVDDLAHGDGPNHIKLVSNTGPLVLCRPETLRHSATLLAHAAHRQVDSKTGRPLPKLYRVLELGGQPAILIERVDGPSLRSLMYESRDTVRKALPHVATAVERLHATFGCHGDLKPDHVHIRGGHIVLIDPIGNKSPWVGSVGYALPIAISEWPGDIGPALGRLRDVGAVAAMVAEAYGGTLLWDSGILHSIANLHNGRFSNGITQQAVTERMRHGTADVPEPQRTWILDVADACVQFAFSFRSPGTAGQWSVKMLERLIAITR